jgi:hypothetical protein
VVSCTVSNILSWVILRYVFLQRDIQVQQKEVEFTLLQMYYFQLLLRAAFNWSDVVYARPLL